MDYKTKIISILSILYLFLSCNGEDITGKVLIEYEGAWSASIIVNYTTISVEGSGNWEAVYKNPDILNVSVTKKDTSLNKITLYILEDGRIAAGSSTRDPEGSINAQYEFPF